MYKTGDYVTYKENGICRIAEETEEYYILQPVYSHNMTVYVPKKSQDLVNLMCRVLTKEEINQIIQETENSQYTWIEDSKARAEYFNKLLRSGDKAAVLWLVKALSLHKIEVEKKKRSFYASDKRILAAAEKVITEEFAFVLGIAPEEVIPYIVNKLHAV
jgi:CarD family transcriptional regulator